VPAVLLQYERGSHCFSIYEASTRILEGNLPDISFSGCPELATPRGIYLDPAMQIASSYAYALVKKPKP
jgi:hypothetical protein